MLTHSDNSTIWQICQRLFRGNEKPPENFQVMVMESKAVGFEQWDKAYGFGLRLVILWLADTIRKRTVASGQGGLAFPVAGWRFAQG